MVSKTWHAAWVLAISIAFFSAQAVLGQTGGGSVTGTVADPSGAVVPRASVTLASMTTGVKLTTQTSSAGQFVFPVVPVGEYTITVSASGFSKGVISNVTVALNQTTNEAVVLRVGTAITTVNVTAPPVHLDTNSAQQSAGIDEQTYSQLPIAMTGSARSPTIVADLMPGVADAPGASTAGPSSGDSQTFSDSIEGGQAFGAEVLYDGVALAQTNVAGDMRVQPIPVEALSEFTLVQNSFSAVYSRTPGGVLSFNTRSGTNQWHGEAYEFNENTSLNARGFFAATTPALRQNEFGVNLGGPIKKDKTFVFGYYSGFRYSATPQQSLVTIPTVAERNGDFSEYTLNGQVVPIYDPATTACNAAGICTRAQFPSNIIPSDRLVSVAKAFLPYIPAPTNSAEINNYLPVGVDTTTENRWGFKLDHYFSDRDIIHGFYGQSPLSSVSGTSVYATPFITNGGQTYPDDYLIARISEDHTFSPSLLNHLTLGYNRDNFSYYCPTSSSNATLGIPNIVPYAPDYLTWSGYQQAGCGDPGQKVIENGSVVDDSLSWIHGKHDLTMGVDFERSQDNTLPKSDSGFSFSYQETDLPSAPNPSLTGNGFASFLLGEVDTASEQDYINEVGNRFQYLGLYIQDNFKIVPKLTLNFGLRYDIPWTRTAAHNVLSAFDPSMPNPGAGGRLGALAFAGYGPDPYCNCIRFDDVRYNGIQPRFGFAYEINPKTVLRGGFGIFDDSNGDVLENGIRIQYADGFNAEPQFGTTNLGITPAFNIENGLPAFTLPPTISPSFDNNGSINYLAPQDGTVGFVENWNFDVQRQLPGNLLLDLGYFANSAHHLAGLLLNPDQVNPKYLSLGNALTAPLNSSAGIATGVPLPYPGFTGDVAQALRPYPQYLGINQYNQTDANSHYNSLQLKLQRSFTNGLSVLVSYTYSKLITDAEEGESWYSPYGGGSQNSYDLAAEMAPSGIDPPQILKLTYVYQFPFGKGKRFVNHGGVASALAGGWEVSAIQTYQSGFPLSVTISNTLPLFNYSLRPNIVSGASLKANYSGSFNPATDVYLNAGAFAEPAPFTFGDAARVLPVRSFAYYDEDVGLSRHFRFKERWDLQISAHAFNLFNRVTFGSPDTTPFAPGFGVVSSQINSPRVVQLAADLHF
jgi:outer membrane receptor protein involved in Fe transport